MIIDHVILSWFNAKVDIIYTPREMNITIKYGQNLELWLFYIIYLILKSVKGMNLE